MTRTFLITVLVAGVTGTSAQAAIFGTDDRVTPPTSFSNFVVPIRAAGRRASAFIVNKCFAATAQHVVAISEKKFARPQLKIGEKWVRATTVARGGAPVKAPWLNYRSDWALLALETCLPDNTQTAELVGLNYKNLSYLPNGIGGVAALGFPVDRRGLMLDPNCKLYVLSADGWLNDCAALPGSSGGPIIEKSGDNQHRVVAMLVGATLRPKQVQQFTIANTNIAIPLNGLALALAERLRGKK